MGLQRWVGGYKSGVVCMIDMGIAWECMVRGYDVGGKGMQYIRLI